jgi:hypothetical protein
MDIKGLGTAGVWTSGRRWRCWDWRWGVGVVGVGRDWRIVCFNGLDRFGESRVWEVGRIGVGVGNEWVRCWSWEWS